MAVAVFDADVLIAYLDRDDAHHVAAVERVRGALARRTRRFISTVNYAELLVGPLRTAGRAGADRVNDMMADLRIEPIAADTALSRVAAEVRERTNLTLVDAFVLATAVHAARRGLEDVRVESFDEAVVSAYASHSSAT